MRVSGRLQIVYALLTIAVLAFLDARAATVQLGALVAVPLLVIAYNTGIVRALLVAVAATLIFGVLDFSGYVESRVDSHTLPADTVVLGVAFISLVVTGALLRREVLQRERLQVALVATQRDEEAERVLARTDRLTGLFNRLGFDEQLARAAEAAETVAIAFLDLDDFKSINDRYGHEVGDDVLRAAASRIAGAVRGNDFAARIGGDEFVVIFPAMASPSQIAERIITQMSAVFAEPILVNGVAHKVAASIGVAVGPQDAPIGDALVHVADQRMYLQKAARGGRPGS
jgi:diguanylate cyclase (GGDEF)-like protein